LIAHAKIDDGTPLTIVVPDAVKQDRDAIRKWLAESPEREQVRWRNSVDGPVFWQYDGKHHRTSELIRYIIETATGEPPQADIWAQSWYRDAENRTLHQIAEPLT
jgi:hypothetical protein